MTGIEIYKARAKRRGFVDIEVLCRLDYYLRVGSIRAVGVGRNVTKKEKEDLMEEIGQYLERIGCEKATYDTFFDFFAQKEECKNILEKRKIDSWLQLEYYGLGEC